MRNKTVTAAALAALLITVFSAGCVQVCAQPVSVELNSQAARDGSFIAVDEMFETRDGQLRELIMTGLKTSNKDQMIHCLMENYCETQQDGLKVINPAFCDAEKWDSNAFNTYYDSLQCWAASAANMLWISGWTQYLNYPEDMQPFSSEDEIFQLYNARFSDEGGDVDRALDWFFMGEFFVSGMKKSTFLMSKDPADGFLKEFVSSLAQNQYDLTEDAGNIRQLLRIGPEDAQSLQGQSVFQGSIGTMLDGEAIDSDHSITIAGVILDPAAQTLQDQFRAIILIDSDNDAHPSEQESFLAAAATAQDVQTRDQLRRSEEDKLKANRPNSVTVYPLQYIIDINGIGCWEIVGYNDPEDEYWEPELLYSINELMLPSEALIESLREESGSLDHINDPDLTLDTIFMTGDSEGFTDPYFGRINQVENAVVTGFVRGEAVRLSYFVSNRSEKSIETDVPDEQRPVLEWKVTRDLDGAVMAQGIHYCELPLFAGYEGGTEKPNLITLNETDGEIQSWEPGEYTVTVQLNPDHAVREAYYRNNLIRTLHFSVTESKDPS